ncbi:ABC-F family ATP-binding cassette domain-containing protein [Scrofimicrobium sp. R131]|uniref:ABC-F family ATP-binding cassette domain-containing protein n=1 Tax=Scrofimicrobium appendicitidis TaxID=3079930 RepID=A0AAU7V928_9ACTO
MAHLLGAEKLHLEYPTTTIFTDVTLGISEGDRIGIVGRNGDGKTTLLRLLAGDLEPDRGQVIPRGDLRVGYLGQADQFPPEVTVREAVVGDLAEHEWAGESRIREIIAGLVADLPWESRVGELSGGQVRRVALASLLVQEWDLLILDEPTNHLDLQAIAWLARHLQQRWAPGKGGLLVVTHDRWFLDEVSNATWEVHDGIVEPFEGGYAAYVLQRVERDRQAAVKEAKRQNLLRKELAWLRRGAPARTSKPKFRLDAASALISDVPPLRDSVQLSQLATARLGKRVVVLLDVSFSYGDNPILSDITWRIAPGERSAILGANGAGKSTLLRLIEGDLSPTSGLVRHGKTVKLAVLDQRFRALEDIAEDRVREVLARTKTSFEVDGKELTPAQLLERLGFSTAHLSAYVGELSGGQKRRLQLLLILLSQPNVLILDEPTNDVDHEMLTAMEDLLDSWPGTLIVVSHDRYLVERVTDQQYAILDGTLRHLPGGVDEYLALSAAGGGSGLPESSVGSGPAVSGLAESGLAMSGLSGAERRALEKELAAIERKLARISGEIAKVHEQMAAHDQSDYSGLSDLTAKLRAKEDEVDDLESRWLELSNSLE